MTTPTPTAVALGRHRRRFRTRAMILPSAVIAALLALPACGSGNDQEAGGSRSSDPFAAGPAFAPPESGDPDVGSGRPAKEEGSKDSSGATEEKFEGAQREPLNNAENSTVTPEKETPRDDREREVDDKGRPVDIDGKVIPSGGGKDDKKPDDGKSTPDPDNETKQNNQKNKPAKDNDETATGPGGKRVPSPKYRPVPPKFVNPQGNPPSPVIIPADQLARVLMLVDRDHTVDVGVQGWVSGMSADGKTVVVAQPEGNAVNLYRVDTASRTATPITRGEAIFGSADVSGNRLAMAANLQGDAPMGQARSAYGPPATPDPNADFEIFAINDDGSALTQLTDNQAHDTLPDWSPDGTRVAYTSDEDGDFDIYVMNADGTDRRRLTDNTAEDGFPSWSPDGTRIAYATNADGDYDIQVMAADGSAARPVTANPIDDIFPEWSTEGIAFSRQQDGDFELYFVADEAADGSAADQPKERLTRNKVDDAFPAASADSDRIAFTRFEDKPQDPAPSGGDKEPSTRGSPPAATTAVPAPKDDVMPLSPPGGTLPRRFHD